MTTSMDTIRELEAYADPSYAKKVKQFFKTGPGEYAEKDVFIGIRVPDLRAVCKKYSNLPIEEIKKLLYSSVHEHRFAAVVLLRERFEKGDQKAQSAIHRLYLDGLKDNVVNNWDIIDVSAGAILGEYSRHNNQAILYDLAEKGTLWEKRAAIVATSAHIRSGDSKPTRTIAERYVTEPHDLLHKATGWMLREVGKQIGEDELTHFLDINAANMPRTMLRYACESLDPSTRAYYYSAKQRSYLHNNSDNATTDA